MAIKYFGPNDNTGVYRPPFTARSGASAKRTFTVASRARRQTCAASDCFPCPTRRSVMLLRANFLLEEAIAVRTPDLALPPDSTVG